MKLHDSVKGFQQGIGKVVPPKQTYQRVLSRLRKQRPPILKDFYVLLSRNNIPQVIVAGTERFSRVAGKANTNGKGHSRDQALASGLVELVERYSCFLRLQKHDAVGSFRSLGDNPFTIRDFYSSFTPGDLRRARIISDATLEKATIRWYKGFDLDGRQLFLPANLIMFVLQGSNGMAAGNTREEALLQGIGEVLERHCVTLIESKEMATPSIALESIASPIARRLIQRFRAQGQKLLIKDFSLDLSLPVIGVIRQMSARQAMLTAGAASSPEEALIRALVENSQIEASQNYKPVDSIGHHLKKGASIPLCALPDISDNNIRLELEAARDMLSKKNMKVYFIDATQKKLDVPSVIVFIAGAKFSEGFLYDTARRFAFQRSVLTGLMRESLRLKRYAELDRYCALSGRLDHMDTALFYQSLAAFERGKYKAALAAALAVMKKTRTQELLTQAQDLIKKIMASSPGSCGISSRL